MQTQLLCDGVYYLTKEVMFQVLLKMEDIILCHTMNKFPKWDSPALTVHTMTYFLHFTAHILQNGMTHDCKNIINDILCFTTDTIFLWPSFLDPNSKCSLVGQLLDLEHSCNNNTHYTLQFIGHKIPSYKYKSIFFSGNMQHILHSVFLEVLILIQKNHIWRGVN
jgi:hypothetical protein